MIVDESLFAARSRVDRRRTGNGVAIRKNPFDPNWRGFYVNVQVGESLLTTAIETIQRRFKAIYDAERNPGFAMDIEFKIDAAGTLVVKQARPWVD